MPYYEGLTGYEIPTAYEEMVDKDLMLAKCLLFGNIAC